MPSLQLWIIATGPGNLALAIARPATVTQRPELLNLKFKALLPLPTFIFVCEVGCRLELRLSGVCYVGLKLKVKVESVANRFNLTSRWPSSAHRVCSRLDLIAKGKKAGILCRG